MTYLEDLEQRLHYLRDVDDLNRFDGEFVHVIEMIYKESQFVLMDLSIQIVLISCIDIYITKKLRISNLLDDYTVRVHKFLVMLNPLLMRSFSKSIQHFVKQLQPAAHSESLEFNIQQSEIFIEKQLLDLLMHIDKMNFAAASQETRVTDDSNWLCSCIEQIIQPTDDVSGPSTRNNSMRFI